MTLRCPSWWRREVFTPPDKADQARAARPDTIAELRDALAACEHACDDAEATIVALLDVNTQLQADNAELRRGLLAQNATEREVELRRECEQLRRNLLAQEDRIAWYEGRRRPGVFPRIEDLGMSGPLEFVVFGKPRPQGSKRPIPIYRGSAANGTREFTGRAVLLEQNSATHAVWRDAVTTAAVKAASCSCGDPACHDMLPSYPLDMPLRISLVFTMAKPAKPRWPWPAVDIGDLDKLARAVGDALQAAGVIKDDCLIVDYGRLSKVYPDADPWSLDVPGVRIRIEAAPLPRWERRDET